MPVSSINTVTGSIVSGSSDARTKTRLAKCYAKLEQTGLEHDVIVMGMSALVGGSYEAIVDWLLLHVPRERLPLTLGGLKEVRIKTKMGRIFYGLHSLPLRRPQHQHQLRSPWTAPSEETSCASTNSARGQESFRNRCFMNGRRRKAVPSRPTTEHVTKAQVRGC